MTPGHGSAGDHCIGVQKAVQIILRRTLFRNRLEVSPFPASLHPSVRSTLPPTLQPSHAHAPSHSPPFDRCRVSSLGSIAQLTGTRVGTHPLQGDKMVDLEYAGREPGSGYKGRIELPLVGHVRV